MIPFGTVRTYSRGVVSDSDLLKIDGIVVELLTFINCSHPQTREAKSSRKTANDLPSAWPLFEYQQWSNDELYQSFKKISVTSIQKISMLDASIPYRILLTDTDRIIGKQIKLYDINGNVLSTSTCKFFNLPIRR